MHTLADRRHNAELTPSRRPVHVVVVVHEGNVPATLKLMKRKRDECGLSKLMRQQSHIFAYETPGRRRRAKQHAALMRGKKTMATRRRREEVILSRP